MNTKVWWKSKTIQGLIITVLALAFPTLYLGAGHASGRAQGLYLSAGRSHRPRARALLLLL